MNTLTLRSPAKINLFLSILGKRPDGYHELASLFQAVDLIDLLHYSLATVDKLTCSDPALPVDASNLVLKAADLFRRKTGLEVGLQAHLEKRIPHQAGLGGGSGNAATTLWALNELTGRMASNEQLAAWSSEIGSDIPFFFSEGTAYCTGRGENLHPQKLSSQSSYWIVKPARGTSTHEVYQKLDLGKLGMRDPLIALDSFKTDHPHYFNDLEEPAFEVMPELARIKANLLASGFSTVILSGSGSSFFCIGANPPPELHGCQIYRVHSIQRTVHTWY